MRFTILLRALSTALLLTAKPLAAQKPLPPIPSARGEFAIRVQYPKAGSVLDIADSTFLFGSVGDGRAQLTVDGVPVSVAPNGAWLAWVAIPADSAVLVRLEARLDGRTLTSELPLVRAAWFRATGAWVAAASMQPTGRLWLPPGEALPLRVRAVPGATVRLLLADGSALAFAPGPAAAPVPARVLAFERGDQNHQRRPASQSYQADLSVATAGSLADWLDDPAVSEPRVPQLEVVLAGDTTRLPWPITVRRDGVAPRMVQLEDAPSEPRDADRVVIGRNLPGGTYHWFFPAGTIAMADARQNDLVRLQLGDGAIAWVPRAEVMRLGANAASERVVMGSLTMTPTASGARLRVPLSHPVPHQVSASATGFTITLFGVSADADWTRYPVGTSFVKWLGWRQVAADRLELDLTFDQPLWGWRVTVDRGDLVFEFRKPPAVDLARPLRGRVIVLDPGHPPGGACGPTALCEPEVTLAVAQLAAERLRAAGARVTLTRTDAGPVGLWPRVARADSLGAEVLISIHLNAFPDGSNPFVNNGSSTFFQHPQAIGLAQLVQRQLVTRLGLRDLGVARGDLALVRPTWYPAILTEGLFLMVPAQEAAMRTLEGRRRYADAIVAGVREFLAKVALSTAGRPKRPPTVSSSDRRESP